MRQCLNPDCLSPNSDKAKFCLKCGHKLLLVERYWAKMILGEGGFGRTFLAVDEFKPSKSLCVIKQFLPQAQGTTNVQKASELFAQEAQRLEELGQHPQIPTLFAYFTHQNRQYLVQEFIDGQTLQQELESKGIYTEPEIYQLLQDLLPLLNFVHQNKIIHRDLKPENIIRRNSDSQLVLVDFGAAKSVASSPSSAPGTIIGTVQYCAPEQAKGKPDFISDLYSLGVTCLHLLTNVEPTELFDDWQGEWLWRKHLKLNTVSHRLGQIIDKLIEPKPKDRYQSVAAVLNDLQLKDATSRYPRLETFLKTKQWQEADLETSQLICQLAQREQEGWLDYQSIKSLSYSDVLEIDRLWRKYSYNRFGFSIQKRIYQSLVATQTVDAPIMPKFGEIVGWRNPNSSGWLSHSELTFDLSAPEGHLPRGLSTKGFRSLFSKGRTAFFERI